MNGTAHDFAAELFHPGLGNEVVKGRVFLEPQALAFRSDATTIDIPVERLLVELGEEEGRIYFRDQNIPGLRIFTKEESVLHARGGLADSIRNQLSRTATRRR